MPPGPVDTTVPVRSLDHHNCPGVTSDPFAAYDRFRTDRIFWSPEYGGFWVLTRYTDIRAVLSDAQTFSNRAGSIPPAGWPRLLIPEELDPPDHGKYRTVVTRSLSGVAGQAITAATQRECAKLVAHLAAQGTCEFVTDFSRPIQNALFTALFTVPAEDATTCAQWVADLLQQRDPPRRLRAVGMIRDYLTRRIAERAADPASTDGGLLDTLADARIDGRRLDDEELLDIAFFLVLASLDTLASTLNFSFYYLAQHPDTQRELATNPDRASKAAEEMLRLNSIVNIARTATRDTTLAEVPIKRGDRVLLCLSLAGRDPDTYSDPTTANFDRSTTPGHLAFGVGPHRCPGSRIATLSLTGALREWHRHIPTYTIPPGAEIRTGGGAACSLDALPLTWSISGQPAEVGSPMANRVELED